jgi:Spy/CpxP family protein refolding chaperone
MKNRKNKLRSLLLAGTVLVVPLTMAQGNGGERNGSDRDPEARVERMTRELGLDAGQAARIKALSASNAERVAAIKTIENEDLRRKEMRENHQAMREAVQSILTPEQRAKAEALRAERKVQRGDAKGSWSADPEERAETRTEWMTKELALSTDQTARMKAINLQHMKKVESVKSIEDVEQRKKAMVEVRKSHQAAIQATLTPEQQARMKEIKAERKAMQEERKGEGGNKNKEWKGKK